MSGGVPGSVGEVFNHWRTCRSSPSSGTFVGSSPLSVLRKNARPVCVSRTSNVIVKHSSEAVTRKTNGTGGHGSLCEGKFQQSFYLPEDLSRNIQFIS